MPEYKWPDMNQRTLLGKRVSRLDGPEKVSGRAKKSRNLPIAQPGCSMRQSLLSMMSKCMSGGDMRL